MQTAIRWAAAVSLIACSCISAPARDIHVDNLAGNDRFTGGQPRALADGDGPVRTIARALRLADSGDRILLAATGQPYREGISLVGRRHSGTPERPFRIEGNGAVLEGAEPVADGAWQHGVDTVYRFRPPDLAYAQLFMHGVPVPRVICSRAATFPLELEPLEWCLHEGYLHFRTEPYMVPDDYPLTVTARPVGITLFHVEHVQIVDLTVQGFYYDGINAHNSARNVVLERVTCRGNARAGISVGGASLVGIEECLVGNNGEAQLLTHPYSHTYILNSQLLSNTAPAWVDRGGTVILDGERIEGGINEMEAE